jgi:hypothetical protein
MVDCDLTLVFKIGPAPKKVKEFVYLLGARRFDEFLYAAVEEGIRHLIRTCLHTEIYELRGTTDARVKNTMDMLNKKFGVFGVFFETMAITDVGFSAALQRTLQETTEYKSKIEEQEKKQKNFMDEVLFRQTRELKELEKNNARLIQDLQAKRVRVEIERDKARIEALSKKEVAVTQASATAEVSLVKAHSELKNAKNQGLKKSEEILGVVKAKTLAQRIQVDQEVSTAVYEAEQRLAIAKNQAAALLARAEAEAKAASSLQMKREHDLRMAKLEVLQIMGQNANITVSGAQGDRVLDAILSNDVLGDIKLS